MYSVFVENLKKFRAEYEMSQSEMAKYLGITRQAYNNYETGKRKPNYKVLVKIAGYFSISVESLVGNQPADLEPTETTSVFGHILQQLRENQDMTQTDLAKKLGLSKANVSKYESGIVEPNINTLLLLSNLFCVSIDFLLGNQRSAPALALSKTSSVFGHMLQQLRESMKFSQAALSKKLGVAQSTVGMWESGKREPDYDTLMQIANYFHVPVDYLLGNRLTADSENPNKSKDSSLTQKQIQAFLNEIQAAIDKLLKSLQKEDEV